MRHIKTMLLLLIVIATNAVAQDQASSEPAESKLTLRETHQRCFSNLYGVGVEQNFTQAMYWCKLAASAGAPSSQALLAEIYLNGLGVPKDYKSSAYWYEKAASQGHPHAKFMLYEIYVVDGFGTDADREHGRTALNEAANAGYAKAISVVEETQKYKAIK